MDTCCNTPLTWKPIGSAQAGMQGAQCSVCETIYEKKGSRIYVQKPGERYACAACKTTVKATVITHSIHDGPFLLTGSGKTVEEQIPYCPACEQEPSFQTGGFITPHHAG